MFITFHRSITRLYVKRATHTLRKIIKKLKPDLFRNLQCGHGLRSISMSFSLFTTDENSASVCTVSTGQNFCPWCSGREKVVGDDNNLSNLRESCGDVLKLQRRTEFAGNRGIRVNWCDRNIATSWRVCLVLQVK